MKIKFQRRLLATSVITLALSLSACTRIIKDDSEIRAAIASQCDALAKLPKQTDRTPLPKSIIEPKVGYRKNGCVKLKYDVNPNGETSSIEVLAAYPNNSFEQDAKRAVARWRFQPSSEAAKGKIAFIRFNRKSPYVEIYAHFGNIL